jgi:glucosamine--fructose-6-phosphate aminotransferase (isomerizing)
MDSMKFQMGKAPTFLAATWPLVLSLARELPLKRSRIREVLICGCGDSHHAASGVEHAYAYWGRLPVRAANSMVTARYLLGRPTQDYSATLVIAISSSGEVARTVEAVEIARALGAVTLAVTNNPGSTLAHAAQMSLSVPLPDHPHGPGLLSYLASLLSGFAILHRLSGDRQASEIEICIRMIPEVCGNWFEQEMKSGAEFGRAISGSSCVFVGGGPAYASAMFGAAKTIEAAGEHAWAQDVEEWAHLEYFCEPSGLPTFFLGSHGRCHSRDLEVIDAAKAVGRDVLISAFEGDPGWMAGQRECLSPLGLWAAPMAFAASKARVLDETPFRNFEGGRSVAEGGGASRIRSSERITLSALDD